MLLSEYKDILGVPKVGFHEFTVLGLAFWDMVGTIIIAYIISYYFSRPFLTTFIEVFVFAQFLHIIFGVNTRFLNGIGIKF